MKNQKQKQILSISNTTPLGQNDTKLRIEDP